MSFHLVEKIKKEILEKEKHKPKMEEVGFVAQAGDGIISITGLDRVMASEMVMIKTKDSDVAALVFNLGEDEVGAIVLDRSDKVSVGDEVRLTGEVLSIPVGEELLGRVINPLGEPVDGAGVIFSNKKTERYPLEKKAPGVLARKSVDTPLHTGIKAIDAMTPIGRGQRQLIIGDRGTGKTAVAVDAIINQKNDTARKRPVCVYVAIGQKDSKIAGIVESLRREGALEYTVVLAAPAGSPASWWYLAPYAGAAIGEYFMDKGEDVLVVYDDLSKHAIAYRELSLLLRRPPGREAFPGDVFYLHSRLLERSVRMSDEFGGGSLTALPVIETQLGDVSAYVPTNVISITDGQIYLEAGLFNRGQRPAINAGLSVSRVGSAAQTKAMKKVAGKVRLELAQFRELQAFAQFASDLDEGTKKRIKRGLLMTEILKQNDQEPIPFEEQVIVFWAVLNNYWDDVLVDEVKKKEATLLDYINKMHPDLLKEIRESGELKDETQEKLKAVLKENYDG